MEDRICPKCKKKNPCTEEYFYKTRPTATHKKSSWSYCKVCWREINRLNKQRMKIDYTT